MLKTSSNAGRLDLCARLLTALGSRAPNLDAAGLDKALEDWRLIDVSGAVVMVKGALMHVAAPPEMRGKWFGRSVLTVMSQVLREHGRIETVVMKEHDLGHAFAKRLGFEQVGDSGAMIRYELRALRHA